MANPPGKINSDRLAFLQQSNPTTEKKAPEVTGTDVKAKRLSLALDPTKLKPGAAPTKKPVQSTTTTVPPETTPSVEKTDEVVKNKFATLDRPKHSGRRPPTIREKKPIESKPLPEFTPPAETQESKETKESHETKTVEEQIEEKSAPEMKEEIVAETPTLALTEASTVSTEPQKVTKTTCILVNFNPALGRLFVRGTGPGMSWNAGMEILPKEGQYKLEFDEEGEFEYKFLINDSKWENVPGNLNHKAISGNTETVHPKF